MLVINVMVFPTFQATAAMDEPVQTTVMNAQDLDDALAAMEAGVTPELAMLEQTKPYRAWGKTQKEIYEALFVNDYHIEEAIYRFDTDIAVTDEYAPVSGALIGGEEFECYFSLIGEYDYVSDDNLSADEINELSEANTSILVVAGTISTENGSVDILGTIWQIDQDDGNRDRGLMISNFADSSMIEDFESLNHANLLQTTSPSTNPVFSNCELAYQAAGNTYQAAIQTAKNNVKLCMVLAVAEYAVEMGLCLGLGIKAGAAAAATGGLISIAVAIGIGLCALAAVARAAQNSLACTAQYITDKANALIAYQTALANARLLYGAANCPPLPV
tara:strand:+ start:4734 stop:5729 length:996 start_codon:yes stop_codon:yes gene_type:complete